MLDGLELMSAFAHNMENYAVDVKQPNIENFTGTISLYLQIKHDINLYICRFSGSNIV